MAIGTPVALGHAQGSGASQNTITLPATSAAVPAGGRIICFVSWYHASATVSSTSNGLTWTVDGTAQNSVDTNYKIALLSADAPAGLAISSALTMNFSANVDANTITACYVTGIATSSFTDGTGTGDSQSNPTWSTTNITTTNADDLIVGGSYTDFRTTTNTPGASISEIDDWNATTMGSTVVLEYRIVSSTGSYNLSGDWASPGGTGPTLAVAYKGVAVWPPVDNPAAPPLRIARSNLRLG